jgi:prolyl-tRNA synthetase
MMRDGKALQMGTSHELGQNFAKVFDVTFLDQQGDQVHAWQTSWGSSTRMVGGLIMTHGDDRGLRVPPELAPVQAVVLAVRDEPDVLEAARRLAAELGDSGVRVEVDDRVDTSFGRRATDWELKGVPVRVEVGPRDLAEGQATVVRRITGDKAAVPLEGLAKEVRSALDEGQASLLTEATRFRDERTHDVDDVDAAVEATAEGFARLPWAAVGEAGEARLAEASITVRCLQRPDGTVPDADDEPDVVAVVARSY